MRFLVKVRPKLERTNKSIAEGSFDERMQQILSHIKPEAAYFFEEDGCRTATFVVEIQRASDIPNIGEPFFHGMEAEVRFHPVMSAQDLRESNLQETAKQWSRS
ncbi:MAG: panthothenate synthetase [Acidobacteriaceae bacterium]|nr:panthothenate synthetase [Acidobacteriaceae bacterium]MBV9295287.1 panthothenate synthetase [Acidobacteriaceae bacterium]MBV9766079.1 panthothenate synthetase [Acidobacteriaceae bacterium]